MDFDQTALARHEDEVQLLGFNLVEPGTDLREESHERCRPRERAVASPSDSACQMSDGRPTMLRRFGIVGLLVGWHLQMT